MAHPISMSKDKPRFRESRTKGFCRSKEAENFCLNSQILPVLRNQLEDDPEIIIGRILPCWDP